MFWIFTDLPGTSLGVELAVPRANTSVASACWARAWATAFASVVVVAMNAPVLYSFAQALFALLRPSVAILASDPILGSAVPVSVDASSPVTAFCVAGSQP